MTNDLESMVKKAITKATRNFYNEKKVSKRRERLSKRSRVRFPRATMPR